MKQIFSTLFLFVIGGVAWGQTEFNRAKADSLFTALESHHKAMGVVSVRHKGEPVYVRSIGYRESNGDRVLPHSDQSRFRVGSISKMFTTVLVFQLIEEGKLSLDTKLADFFPQLPNAGLITVNHLLTHSSGLHNFTNDKSYLKIQGKPYTHEQLLKRFAKQKADFIPGTKHQYSNTNFVLLGYIVEKITGKPYAELLQTRIAKPAELNNTYYGGKIDVQKNECHSYTGIKGGWELSGETDMSIPAGAGAVVSTPADLGRFLETLFAEKLIKKESLERMIDIKDGYGHGIFKYPFGPKTSYGHSGAIDGFRAIASYFPAEELAVTFCSNGMNYAMNDILIGVLKIYFNEPYTLPNMETITLSAEQLARYEGVFSATGFPLKITLKGRDGMLTAQATGQDTIPLDAGSETDFSNLAVGAIFKMTLDKGPKVNEFILRQNGQELTFKRDK